MTLTGRARVELHSEIGHAGNAWVYSDTDSCFAKKPLDRNIWDEDDHEEGDDGLGKWAFEGEGEEWDAKAPKVYSYLDVKKGEHVAHAKGVPGATDGDTIAMDVWKRYTAGETIKSERGVKSLLVAARGDDNPVGDHDRLFQRRKLTRRLHVNEEWCGARLRTS